jgi:hypothetical protein
LKYKVWKCALCGEPLIEGQRFVFIPSKGYAHLECFFELLKEKHGDRLNLGVVALLVANEVLLYTIVRLKEAYRLADDENVRNLLLDVRKSIEGLAEKLELKLYEMLGD